LRREPARCTAAQRLSRVEHPGNGSTHPVTQDRLRDATSSHSQPMSTLSRLTWYRRELASLGLLGTIDFKLQRRLARRGAPGSSFEMRSSFAAHSLAVRHGTSDPTVFHEIFVARTFRCLDHLEDAELVIDCGANVGYSTVDFLNRFAGAHVVSVEPDPDNFAMLERNVAPYAPRCTAIRAAVWPHPEGLVLSKPVPGRQQEWGITVHAARPGEVPDAPAVDIGALLQRSGRDRISVLKIDIEGAESELFSTNVEPWVDRFDCLVIELHDAARARVVEKALDDQHLAVSRCDEWTVFERRAKGATVG
jgi:FkbM family methyltransferase